MKVAQATSWRAASNSAASGPVRRGRQRKPVVPDLPRQRSLEQQRVWDDFEATVERWKGFKPPTLRSKVIAAGNVAVTAGYAYALYRLLAG